MGVTGIGGLFFRADDPEALKAWYAQYLGVAPDGWTPWEQQAGPTIFEPFARSSDYFPAERQHMINFRVTGLDAMLERFRTAGIEVVTKAEWDSPEIGRFARIHDPEGNPIELWEPA
ncbi:VOC family protein [Qipengyuania spongiae]|uniref:VOC family protein n=1 Tax=Qipengyuania spongiae TaxID=2909673 RepID=A0ABY5T109_9SPHN|nr:VOC family protein [Qipengyuania spongiae]UVI40468.1 VOC family protein [Qipengyuania spongiae]